MRKRNDAQTAFPFDPQPAPDPVAPAVVQAPQKPQETAKYDDATLADTYRYWADSFRYSQENAIAMVTKDPENAHEWVRIAAMNKQHAADFMAKARQYERATGDA
jgi:hypothetical protein